MRPWVQKLLIGCGLIVCMLSITWSRLFYSQSPYLQIHFLDVGQGDAVLIQTPDGHELLVDGGPDQSVVRALQARQSWYDRHLDVVVATHPDTDHVGGLVTVLEQYDLSLLLVTEAVSNAPAASAFVHAAHIEPAVVQYARAGQLFQLGASTTVQVLAPPTDTSHWPTNAASIVLKVTYGNTALLLTGDASTVTEEYLVDQHQGALRATILKLGHHGSDTSTSERFLDTVQPNFAVISAGLDNPYGHPHPDVVARLEERALSVFHTGESGTVTFLSNGKNVWID